MLRIVPVVAMVAVLAVACGQSTAASPPGSSSGASMPQTGGSSGGALTAPPTSGPLASGSAPAPSGPASPAPGSAAPPSTAPRSPTAGSPRPSDGSDLSGVQDLREFLPTQLGDHPLSAAIFTGADFEAAPGSVSDQMRALLKGLGREPRDLTMAVASDPTAQIDVTVTAFRVRDVAAEVFLEAYVPLIEDSFPNAAINETVLGGRTVYDVSLDGVAVGTTFLYPRDDVLFIVTGTDLTLVDEAFAGLP